MPYAVHPSANESYHRAPARWFRRLPEIRHCLRAQSTFFAGMRDQRRLARFCRQFEQESLQPLLAHARSEFAPGIICVSAASMERHRLTAPRDTRASSPRLRCRRTIGRPHLKDAGNFQEITDRTRDESALDPREKCSGQADHPASSSSVKPRAERAQRMTAPIAARRAASRPRRPAQHHAIEEERSAPQHRKRPSNAQSRASIGVVDCHGPGQIERNQLDRTHRVFHPISEDRRYFGCDTISIILPSSSSGALAFAFS